MALDHLSDETLAARVRAGDDGAFAELASRYRGLIGFVIRRAGPVWNRDDLRQEGLIGLFEACQAHEPSKGGFTPFAATCIRNRVWRAQKSADRRKHFLLTHALSLDAEGDDDKRPTI